MTMLRVVLIVALALAPTEAFIVQTRGRTAFSKSLVQVSRQHDNVIGKDNAPNAFSVGKNTLAAASLVVALTFSAALPCLAVSGGGLDFAGTDISGQDFSGASYKGKDFTQGE
jgi:uncharacterized protein YjbI with pentapeptide repeats